MSSVSNHQNLHPLSNVRDQRQPEVFERSRHKCIKCHSCPPTKRLFVFISYSACGPMRITRNSMSEAVAAKGLGISFIRTKFAHSFFCEAGIDQFVKVSWCSHKFLIDEEFLHLL